jgi:hypothetical protein
MGQQTFSGDFENVYGENLSFPRLLKGRTTAEDNSI